MFIILEFLRVDPESNANHISKTTSYLKWAFSFFLFVIHTLFLFLFLFSVHFDIVDSFSLYPSSFLYTLFFFERGCLFRIPLSLFMHFPTQINMFLFFNYPSKGRVISSAVCVEWLCYKYVIWHTYCYMNCNLLFP